MLCGETGFLKTIDVANTASDFSVYNSDVSDFSSSGGGVSADSGSDTPGGRRECRRDEHSAALARSRQAGGGSRASRSGLRMVHRRVRHAAI